MTTPRSLTTILAGTTAALAAAAILVVPSSAQAAAPAAAAVSATASAPAQDDLPVRFERACLRIPNLEIRTTNLITRLNGDAATRGSLAWLQAQIDDARAKGRTQLVTVLENRLAVRTQSLAVLAQRQTELADLKAVCIERGVEL
jgi:hypothetical protein